MGCASSSQTGHSEKPIMSTTNTGGGSFVSVNALRNENSIRSILSAVSSSCSDDTNSEGGTPFNVPTKPLIGLSFESNTSSKEEGANMGPADEDNAVYKSVSSKYSRVKVIGSGQFGIVYLATDRETGRMVAIKVVKPTQPNTTSCQEYDNLIRCKKHHGIVEAYELFQSPNKVWIVTEYLSGRPWGSSVERNGPVPYNATTFGMIRRILRDALSALEYLHNEADLAHLDIKPENLILVVNPREAMTTVKLIDLGCAVQASTKTKSTFGTLYYCSPERMTSSSKLGDGYCPKKADVWALGVTAVVSIYGNHNCPFDNSWTKSNRIFRKRVCQIGQRGDEVNIPSTICGGQVPMQLLEVLHVMLRPNPRDRPTPGEILQHPYFTSI